MQIVCCSGASLASDMSPLIHTEENESQISQELKSAPSLLRSNSVQDVSQESSASKDILVTVIKARFYKLPF